eukprot:226536_1
MSPTQTYHSIILIWLFIQMCSIHCQSVYLSTGCRRNKHSNDVVAGSIEEKLLQHNNIERSYLVYLPPQYDDYSDEGLPLILNLHGYSSNAWIRMTGSLMNQHASENNYIAVYPQGTTNGVADLFGNNILRNLTSWNDLSCSGSPSNDGPTCTQTYPQTSILIQPDIFEQLPLECQDVFRCNWCNCLVEDVGFIDTLLDTLESTYCIDRSRIYATGYSNGGMMTQRLGCELNHRLAAVAPMHGQLGLGFNCEPKYKHFKMPIINVWGTNDDIVQSDTIVNPISGGYYFTPVYQVMYKYGLHNKCNVNNKLYQPIESISDGILEWKCVGYNECNFNGDNQYNEYSEYTTDVMSCSWNGNHVYPILDNENFALNVVWEFFKTKSKVPANQKKVKRLIHNMY